MDATTNNNNNSYRNKYALVICHHIQRLWRGRMARDRVRVYIWERYNLSASKIQFYWRWVLLRRKRQIIKKLTKKGNKYSKAVKQEIEINDTNVVVKELITRLRRGNQHLKNISKHARFDTQESLTAILNDDYSLEDKINVWRFIIELRRAHPNHNIDSCIKSLLESKGELARAITLLGIPEFALRGQNDNVNTMRMLFFPDYHHLRQKKIPKAEFFKLKAKDPPQNFEDKRKEIVWTVHDIAKKTYFLNFQAAAEKLAKTSKEVMAENARKFQSKKDKLTHADLSALRNAPNQLNQLQNQSNNKSNNGNGMNGNGAPWSSSLHGL